MENEIGNKYEISLKYKTFYSRMKRQTYKLVVSKRSLHLVAMHPVNQANIPSLTYLKYELLVLNGLADIH